LTEKLLLFGGAIQDAGAVKARADQRKATSDWMEIEKQRGISVTSTVLSFEYKQNNLPYHLNLLDTPGHQDFSEDTYRTLAAADNCVMLIDGAKGIEDRTRKLFEVCRMRKLPIFSFVNKMDRPSLSPFELIDQLENEFKLEICPMVSQCLLSLPLLVIITYYLYMFDFTTTDKNPFLCICRTGRSVTVTAFKVSTIVCPVKSISFSEEIDARKLLPTLSTSTILISTKF